MTTQADAPDKPVAAAPVVEATPPAEDLKGKLAAAEERAQSYEAQVAGLTRTFGSQIADNNALVQAQGEAVKSGDWEPYEKLVKQINEKAAMANAAALNQVVIDRAAASIGKVEKKLGKDFVSDPLFESARKSWREGNFAQAAIEANEIYADTMEGQTAAEKKATAKAVADAAAKATKDTEERLGKFDLGAGAEAGGAGTLSLTDLTKKPTRGMTPKELREHSLALDKAMGFKSR